MINITLYNKDSCQRVRLSRNKRNKLNTRMLDKLNNTYFGHHSPHFEQF